MKKIIVEGQVRLDWLVEQIADELDHEELFEFVKTLDLRAADYDFTVSLRDHFIAAVAAEDAGEVQ